MTSLTKSNQEEIDKRLLDKEWRIRNLYKIVDKEKNLIKFVPNKAQRLFREKKWSRNIVLKARQLGITTDACIDMLDDVLFTKNFTAVIIAHEKVAVIKIFKKVKIAWEHFPQELKAYLGYKANTDSANELSFNNGSSISVALSSRSDTVNRLHVSEFGKICRKYPLKAEEIITGAIPSVPESGRIDIESTAEGEYGAFYEMFWDAWNSGQPAARKQFKAFFFPWTCGEEYSLEGDFDIPPILREYQDLHKLTDKQTNWYFVEQQTLKGKMQQENPTTPEEAFEASGHKLFDRDALAWQKQFLEDGRSVNDWIILSEYKATHRYAIGADVAEGVGQDSSTAVVFDFTTSSVAAFYKSNTIEPDIFGHVLAKMGERYGWCLLAPERNNHGHTTLATLKHIYDNIFSEIRTDRETDKQTDRLGWHTNRATKPKMMFELSDAITERLIKVVSKPLLTELRTYDQEDLSVTRFDPDQTKHWDLVIALAIAWQMRTEVSTPSLVQEVVEEAFDAHSPL
jgi:hypothetical protein